MTDNEEATEDQLRNQTVRKLEQIIAMVTFAADTIGIYPILGDLKTADVAVKINSEPHEIWFLVETDITGLNIPTHVGDIESAAILAAKLMHVAKTEWGDTAWTAALDQAKMKVKEMAQDQPEEQ